MKQGNIDGLLSQNIVRGSWISSVSVPASIVEDGFGNPPEEHHEPGANVINLSSLVKPLKWHLRFEGKAGANMHEWSTILC
jgi:hypothetical protein